MKTFQAFMSEASVGGTYYKPVSHSDLTVRQEMKRLLNSGKFSPYSGKAADADEESDRYDELETIAAKHTMGGYIKRVK